MKKALSIILALTLAFSLLPTFAFATETETETVAPTAFSVDFVGISTDTITPYKETSDNYGKRWYIKLGDTFQGSGWKLLIDETISNAFGNTKNETVQYFSTANYVPLSVTEALSTCNTIAFEITAETAGVYNIAVIGRSSGSGVDFSASVNEIDIGEWSLHKDKSGVAAGQKVTCASTVPVFLNQGANVLKIKQAVGQNGYFGFEFTPVTVTSAEIILPENMTIGETKIPGVKITTADGETEYSEIPDGMDVVISSDSSSVKAGEKAVAAYLEGTANITAQVSVNGVELTTEPKQITVSEATEAKAFTIDFSAPISSLDLLYTEEGNRYITSSSTMFGANWQAVTNKNVSTLLKSSNRVRYYKDSRIQFYAYKNDLISESEDDPLRDTMAFDFYVPADGVYDLSAVVYKTAGAGYASLYIDDTLVGKHDLYSDTTIKDLLIDDYDKASLTAGKHRLKIVCAASSVTTSSNFFCNIAFTPSTEDEALTNAFTLDNTDDITDSYVAPSVVSISAGGSVITPEKNSDGSYDIEATEENTDGAKFLYWAKGLKANKKIVSFSNKLENYIPEEDGADWLIAVYDDKLPEANEYYNANGQLLATGEEPALPSMAGYGKANDWKQYGETNIYVAEYSGKTQPDDVEVTVNGEKKTVPYGTEIICTSTEENFKCWTKTNINGNTEIVSADKTYKFKAWENCEVNAVNEVHTYTGDKFKIVIDSFTAGSETGIMAEFIGFGSNVVEKGIMWGSNKIAMTKSGTQFSVIADKNGEYKGYAIVGNATDGYTLITDGSVTVNNAE